MKKLLPIILAIVGLGAGVGAGVALKPAPEPMEDHAADGEHADEKKMTESDSSKDPYGSAGDPSAALAVVEEDYDPDAVWDYVKLPKQFVVPVITKERVSALVVMTISLEAAEGTSEAVLSKQPKIRDSFLQVLFAHANSGGFDGAFTTGQSMRDLRGSLLETVRAIVGDSVNSVLIEEVVKQQM